MLCIYHSKDLDGFTSGAIVKLKHPECKLIGWDYGDPIPWEEISVEEETVMIDISFPMEDMMKVARLTDLTWIDHHKSARKDFEAYCSPDKELITYLYAEGRAACEIGWNWFFEDHSIPVAVTLLGEYDTWRGSKTPRWEEEVMPFQFAMRLECTSPDSFPVTLFNNSELTNRFLNNRILVGKSILKYQREQDMLACKRAGFIRGIDDYKALCVNQGAFSSETLKYLIDQEETIEGVILVGFQFDGRIWKVSLRTLDPKLDVSEIAKKRGGGGHRAAAGFEVKNFEDIFDK